MTKESFIHTLIGWLNNNPEWHYRSLRDYMLDEMGWPTPADPGSQVEAVDPVKLLEWARKNGFFPDIDNEWTKYNHGTRSYEVFKDADLITLYKQSL